MRSVRWIDLLALFVLSAAFTFAVSAAPAVPARIVSVGPTADSVGYVSSSGTDLIDAEIGRWDTPYPYPDTGQYAPGLEPSGFSGLAIDIDVNDGGLVTVRYQLMTYDAGIWDWFDIFLETPTGTIPIITHLGKPASAYGAFWESPSIAISQSLNQWRNQRVRFVFRVAQDGWGDQSVGMVRNFSVATCHVAPLSPITDPVAQQFEAGNNVDTTDLNAATQTGLDCMQQRVAALGGSLTVNSAYRPVSYQAHLREVWDAWDALKNDQSPECQELKNIVQQEFQRHQLLLSQRPGAPNPNSAHSTGNAIDANISSLPSGETVDTVADYCSMQRPWPETDPVHFQPR
jgi:hypothetical protein